jgi:hypothetical protein
MCHEHYKIGKKKKTIQMKKKEANKKYHEKETNKYSHTKVKKNYDNSKKKLSSNHFQKTNSNSNTYLVYRAPGPPRCFPIEENPSSRSTGRFPRRT